MDRAGQALRRPEDVRGDGAHAAAAEAVGVDAAANYQRFSALQAVPGVDRETSVVDGGLNISYELDLFGRIRSLTGAALDRYFATEAAARALRREGVPAARIHMTGNSGIDALRFVAGRARPSARRARPLVLATVHRRENLGPELDRIAGGLAAVAAAHRVEMVVPVHPNPAIGARLPVAGPAWAPAASGCAPCVSASPCPMCRWPFAVLPSGW